LVLDGFKSLLFSAVNLMSRSFSQSREGFFRGRGMGYAAREIRAISGKTFE
jgi:hypothetical protein